MESSTRLNVTLDSEHAAKLSMLAGRTRVCARGNAGRGAVLSSALDKAYPDPAPRSRHCWMESRALTSVPSWVWRTAAQGGAASPRRELAGRTREVAREVELVSPAVEDLDRMMTHSLPPDTRARVQRSPRILERFPSVGREMEGRWDSIRFILGPWRWLLLVYVHDKHRDLAIVLTIQDARSSTAVTNLIPPHSLQAV